MTLLLAPSGGVAAARIDDREEAQSVSAVAATMTRSVRKCVLCPSPQVSSSSNRSPAANSRVLSPLAVIVKRPASTQKT